MEMSMEINQKIGEQKLIPNQSHIEQKSTNKLANIHQQSITNRSNKLTPKKAEGWFAESRRDPPGDLQIKKVKYFI